MQTPASTARTLGLALAGAALSFLAASSAHALDGKEVFIAQKCNLCHGVSSAGVAKTSEKVKAPDLTGTVTVADEARLTRFVRKLEPNKDGKKHGKEFKGTDEEIKAILDWLATQKAK